MRPRRRRPGDRPGLGDSRSINARLCTVPRLVRIGNRAPAGGLGGRSRRCWRRGSCRGRAAARGRSRRTDVRTLRGGLPAVPDLDAYAREAPQSNRILAADGTVLAEKSRSRSARRRGIAAGRRTRRCRPAAPSSRPCSPPRTSVLRARRRGSARHRARRAGELAGRARRRGRVDDHAAGRAQPAPRDRQRANGPAQGARGAARAARSRSATGGSASSRPTRTSCSSARARTAWPPRRARTSRETSATLTSPRPRCSPASQAPGRLDPFHHPEAARARRDEVLARMLRAELIDETSTASQAAAPLGLRAPASDTARRVPWYTEAARGRSSPRRPRRLRTRRARHRDRRAAPLGRSGDEATRAPGGRVEASRSAARPRSG